MTIEYSIYNQNIQAMESVCSVVYKICRQRPLTNFKSDMYYVKLIENNGMNAN